MHFYEHRTLIQALALSVAVHAVLLLDVVRIYPPELGAPAIAMKVVIEQKRPPDPVKAVSPAQEKPREKSKPARVSQPEPSKAPPILPIPPRPEMRRAEPESPRIAVREASPVIVPSVTESSSGVAAETSLPASSSTPAPAIAGMSATSDAPSAREGASADDLRQYRVSLASAARRFKRYPALAREQGWEGTAEVAIRFRSALPAPDVILVRSSGRDLLDEQAMEMLAQAARATSMPEGLRGHDFQIPLPVAFSLDEVQ